MKSKRCKAYVSEDELRAYGNVPVTLAARYLHTNSDTLKAIMLRKGLPFGVAITLPGRANAQYLIAPERLIAWAHGHDLKEAVTA